MTNDTKTATEQKSYRDMIYDYWYHNSFVIIRSASYLIFAITILTSFGLISNPAITLIAVASAMPLAMVIGYVYNHIIDFIVNGYINTSESSIQVSNDFESRVTTNKHIDVTKIPDSLEYGTILLLLSNYPRALPYLLEKNEHRAKIYAKNMLGAAMANIRPYNYEVALTLFEKSDDDVAAIAAINELKLQNKRGFLISNCSYMLLELASYAYALFIVASSILAAFAITSNLYIILAFLGLSVLFLTPLIIRRAKILKTIFSLEEAAAPKSEATTESKLSTYIHNFIYAAVWAYVWFVLSYAASSYIISMAPVILPYAAIIIPATTLAVFLSVLFNFEDYAQLNEHMWIHISTIILYTSLCMGVLKVSLTLQLIHVNIVHHTVMGVMSAQLMPCIVPLIILTIISIPMFFNLPKMLSSSIKTVQGYDYTPIRNYLSEQMPARFRSRKPQGLAIDDANSTNSQDLQSSSNITASSIENQYRDANNPSTSTNTIKTHENLQAQI